MGKSLVSVFFKLTVYVNSALFPSGVNKSSLSFNLAGGKAGMSPLSVAGNTV